MEILRATWVIAYREILRFVQQRSRLVGSFAMPLLFLVIFGAGLNRLIGVMAPGVGYLQFMYPGIVSMTVVMTSLFSGLSIVWDREFGFLKEVLVAPLSRTGVILGKAVGAAVVALVQAALLLLAAPLLGIAPGAFALIALVPVIALVSLSVSGIGMLAAARMRSQQAFQVVMQLLVFPLVFLSGVFFPVNQVPSWLGVVVRLDPVTYGVDAIRRILLGGAGGARAAMMAVSLFGHRLTLVEEIGLVTAMGAVLMVAAAWSFAREEG